MISLGQIFLPSGSLPAVRGVATGLICLLLRCQIECVHRECVNGQKCDGAGTWRAGPLRRNFFQRLPDRTVFITAVMSGVMLLGPGWKLRCFCYLQAAHVSVLLGDNSRTLQMFLASLLLDVSSQSQFPASAGLATDFTPAQDGHELPHLARCSPPFMLPF